MGIGMVLLMLVVAGGLSVLCVSPGRTSLRRRRRAEASPITARLRREDTRWRVPCTFMLGTGCLAAAWIRIGLAVAGEARAWAIGDWGEIAPAQRNLEESS